MSEIRWSKNISIFLTDIPIVNCCQLSTYARSFRILAKLQLGSFLFSPPSAQTPFSSSPSPSWSSCTASSSRRSRPRSPRWRGFRQQPVCCQTWGHPVKLFWFKAFVIEVASKNHTSPIKMSRGFSVLWVTPDARTQFNGKEITGTLNLKAYRTEYRHNSLFPKIAKVWLK